MPPELLQLFLKYQELESIDPDLLDFLDASQKLQMQQMLKIIGKEAQKQSPALAQVVAVGKKKIGLSAINSVHQSNFDNIFRKLQADCQNGAFKNNRPAFDAYLRKLNDFLDEERLNLQQVLEDDAQNLDLIAQLNNLIAVHQNAINSISYGDCQPPPPKSINALFVGNSNAFTNLNEIMGDIETLANYLKENPTKQIIITGNTASDTDGGLYGTGEAVWAQHAGGTFPDSYNTGLDNKANVGNLMLLRAGALSAILQAAPCNIPKNRIILRKGVRSKRGSSGRSIDIQIN